MRVICESHCMRCLSEEGGTRRNGKNGQNGQNGKRRRGGGWKELGGGVCLFD